MTEEPLARAVLRRAYELHRLSLLRLSTLLFRDHETAEDIVQDVFVRAAPRLSSLGDEEVGPYLRRSVVNAWKNGLRHHIVEISAAPKLMQGELSADPALEERDATWREISKLPGRQRACVVLRYYEDLSDGEIAALLGCRIGTVKSQSSRALAKLRKAVSP